MRPADLIRLVVLAALWGASFLFMRIVAPVLGPLWTVEARVGVAGAAMLGWLACTAQPLHLRRHWRQYLVLGVLNSALPFSLYAYAALTLPAGYSAIINATSPLWGALVAALMLSERLNLRKASGLALGVAGVAVLVRLGPAQFTPAVLAAALACLGAALCYGLGATYSKLKSSGIQAAQLATGSQLAAAVVLLPLLPLAPLHGEITPLIALFALLLALLCTALAYFIYFRLIADCGPATALTVTFLIPLFALFWGALFLGEAINGHTLTGCAMVVLATWLVAFQRPAQRA